MKKKDFFLVVVLLGLIIFLIVDLREGGSGISSHIAGVFRMLLFSGSSDSKALVAPTRVQETMPAPSAIAPSVDLDPISTSSPESPKHESLKSISRSSPAYPRYESPRPAATKEIMETSRHKETLAYESKAGSDRSEKVAVDEKVAADNDRVAAADPAWTPAMPERTVTAAPTWEMKAAKTTAKTAKKH
jgi:hypothetical protein